MYEQPTTTVYLSRPFALNRLFAKSVLLHELVHHLQEFNAIEFECWPAPEPQAYELQEQPVGVDRFSVYAFSICPK